MKKIKGITKLDLQPNDIVDINYLAELFDRNVVSITRAVERGELPPPIKVLGLKRWPVKALNNHFDKMIKDAEKKHDSFKRKLEEI